MSRTNPEYSNNPDRRLTPAELENLNRLERIAHDGLDAYVDVGVALAMIRDRHLYRDSHPSFEAYVLDRWRVNLPDGDPVSRTPVRADAPATPVTGREPGPTVGDTPCEVLAKACEQTLSALSDEERNGIEIRLAVRRTGDPDATADGGSLDPWRVAESVGEEMLPKLRWLLAEAAGTIGEVAHRLETHAADIDDDAREQIRDDVIVLDGELAVVKALLADDIDWDSELARLLNDELPPLDPGTEPDDD
jgi:hypothetical protein